MRYQLVGLLAVVLQPLLSVVALPLIGGFASAATARVRIGSSTSLIDTERAASTSTDDAKDEAKSKLAPVLVKLTHVETDPEYTRLGAALDTASHTAISGIPGVTVLGDDDDEVAMAKKTRKPVVVLSGRLQNLAASKQGDEVEYRAQMQYVIYRIPGRDIAAVVDGNARTRISAIQVKSKESRQQVEDDVAAAAVANAVRRAPAALLAIMKK
jgi:hypothetical protein